MTAINLNGIKLVNWNANSTKYKKTSLLEFITNHLIDMSSLTKIHLKNHETFKVNGFNIYRKDRDA